MESGAASENPEAQAVRGIREAVAHADRLEGGTLSPAWAIRAFAALDPFVPPLTREDPPGILVLLLALADRHKRPKSKPDDNTIAPYSLLFLAGLAEAAPEEMRSRGWLPPRGTPAGPVTAHLTERWERWELEVYALPEESPRSKMIHRAKWRYLRQAGVFDRERARRELARAARAAGRKPPPAGDLAAFRSLATEAHAHFFIREQKGAKPFPFFWVDERGEWRLDERAFRDALRASQAPVRGAPEAEDPPEPEPGPAEIAATVESGVRLARAIEELRERYRDQPKNRAALACLSKKTEDGHPMDSRRAAAEFYGVTPDAIRSGEKRVLADLRERLGDIA